MNLQESVGDTKQGDFKMVVWKIKLCVFVHNIGIPSHELPLVVYMEEQGFSVTIMEQVIPDKNGVGHAGRHETVSLLIA